MPLFQKDLSGVDRLRSTLEDVANRAIQFQSARAEMMRQREEDQYINNVITRTKERLSPQQQDVSQLPIPTSDPNRLAPYRDVRQGETLPEGVNPIRRTQTVEPTDIEKNQAYDDAELALLRRRPSARMDQAVATISRMRPRTDQSVTLEDDLRAKRITEEQYMRLKHGDAKPVPTKEPPTVLLEAGRRMPGRTPGVNELGDVYGYKTPDGKEVIKEIKRANFEPGQGASLFGSGAQDTETVNRARPGGKVGSPFTYRAKSRPELISKMEEDLNRIETMPLGTDKKYGFLGIDPLAKDVPMQEEFNRYKNGEIGISELPEALQNLATEHAELKGKIENQKRLLADENSSAQQRTVQPAATAHVQAPPAGKIRIRFKTNAYGQMKGATGSIHPSEFDPATMEKFQ